MVVFKRSQKLLSEALSKVLIKLAKLIYCFTITYTTNYLWVDNF